MILTVFTPTYRRPVMLAQCCASVEQQTVHVEHVIVVDEVGIGIDGMYASMPDHAHLVHGDYVMVLSDDNVLADPDFAAELEERVESNGGADVVMFKGVCGDTIQPLAWEAAPVINQVDLSCFAVERGIWQDNADRWGHRYEGDYDFIRALWDQGLHFDWWDRLAYRALQISRGAAEAIA